MSRIVINVIDKNGGKKHAEHVPLSEAHEFIANSGWIHHSSVKMLSTTADNETIYTFFVYTPVTSAEHDKLKFQRDQLKTWENKCSLRRLV